MDHAYSKSETDLQHEEMRTVISAEIQGVQSAISVKMDGLVTTKDLEDFGKAFEPLMDGYKAFLFSKSFITGLGTLVLSISAIGAGVWWLINHAVGK